MMFDLKRDSSHSLPWCFSPWVKRKAIEFNYKKFVCKANSYSDEIIQPLSRCKRYRHFYVDCDESDCIDPSDVSLFTILSLSTIIMIIIIILV